MQVILEELDLIKKILGNQALKENVEYRLLKYCKILEVEEGALLYNLFTKEMLLLTAEERKEIENFSECSKELSDYLISNWFFVPLDTDERKLFNQTKAIAKLANKKKSLDTVTIFTTTDCNARCFYCYELGSPRRPMSEQTAYDLVDYIKKNCGSDTVRLKWFGGEPLYNEKVINIICDELRKNNIKYYSSMISNGYLFDEDVVKRAKDDWKLSQIQITLDGTEEVYNKCKAYIYKDGSAFQRVVDNIERLASQKIAVRVRLNMDNHNADDLFKLCDYLAERFGDKYKGYFGVYASLLFECNGKTRTEEERHKLHVKFHELLKYMDDKGLLIGQGLNRRLRLNYCIADGDNCITVTPEGKLGKCEHYTDEELWGSIYSDERDEEMLASWKETRPEIEECKECMFYPDCIRLKKCKDDLEVCTDDMRMLKDFQLKRGMIHTYEKHKNKHVNKADK